MNIYENAGSVNAFVPKSKGCELDTGIWNDLDESYARCEELFNPLGYIPLLGTVTGTARIVVGQVQIVIGSIGAIYEMLVGSLCSDRLDAVRHYDNLGACCEHQLHGILNQVRGAIETVPLLPLITCLPWDMSKLNYGYRSQAQGTVKVVRDITHEANTNQTTQNPISEDKILGALRFQTSELQKIA